MRPIRQETHPKSFELQEQPRTLGLASIPSHPSVPQDRVARSAKQKVAAELCIHLPRPLGAAFLRSAPARRLRAFVPLEPGHRAVGGLWHLEPARLLDKIRSTLPLVNVELKEGPEALQIPGLQSGAFDISIGHLGESYDQIESMLLIREPIVVALPKGHKAARKKTMALKDLEGELFMIPSKDLFPSLHQLIATAFIQNHVSFKRYQMVGHFQTAVALTMPRAGFAFLPASAKSFVPEGVVLRAPSFRIRPLETFALWSNGNVDPLIQRVLSLLKEVRRDL